MMDNRPAPERLRKTRIYAALYGFRLGKAPETQRFQTSGGFFEPMYHACAVGIVIGVLASLSFEIFIWIVHAFELGTIKTRFRGVNLFFWSLLIGFAFIIMIPYLSFIARSLRYGLKNAALHFQNVPFSEKLFANIVLSFCLMMTFIPYLDAPFKKAGVKFADFEIMIFCWLAFIAFLALFMLCLPKIVKERSEKPSIFRRLLKRPILKVVKAPPFGLWLGTSTGRLANLYHKSAFAPNQEVALFADDAAQNILVLGAIGSGKTTCIIHPLLLQLLEQDCGGLIFDIKADFKRSVAAAAQLTGREYITLGPSALPFNLIEGLTPEIASSHLKSAILLGDVGDSFWVDTSAELCRNALGILSFFPEHYSLHGLYLLLFAPDFASTLQTQIDELQFVLNNEDKRRLASYDTYLTHVFGRFDEKTQAGVKATLAQILSPFSHPALIDAFCTPQIQPVFFESLLEGKIILVDLPVSIWGLGAKTAYTLIKLRFFNLMQIRNTRSDLNQDRHVFFMCDEYQEVISASKTGLSDLNFWDKARSSKTVGIISAQAMSSFYAVLPSRDLADAIIQNFRQKLCFRTEDRNTIDLFNRLLGNVEVTRMAYSKNQGSSSSTTGFLSDGNASSSTQQGTGSSVSIHDKPLLDGQFFRQLAKGEVLACLSVTGMGIDDVLKVQPYYLSTPP